MPAHCEFVCKSTVKDADEFLLPNNINIKFTASHLLSVNTSTCTGSEICILSKTQLILKVNFEQLLHKLKENKNLRNLFNPSKPWAYFKYHQI